MGVECPYLVPAASIALLSWKLNESTSNAWFIALNGYLCSNVVGGALESNEEFGIHPKFSEGLGPEWIASVYFSAQQFAAQYAVNYIITKHIDNKYDKKNGWKYGATIFTAAAIATTTQMFYNDRMNYLAPYRKPPEERYSTDTHLYLSGFLATISASLLLLLTYRFATRKKAYDVETTEEEEEDIIYML